ncbi:MAG: hypothetical protein ACTSX9_08475 [Candidatus Njordarchaeales archaeon]
MRSLRDLWNYSKIVYREMLFRMLSFQQTVSITDPESIKKLARSANQSLYLHKIFMLIATVIITMSTAFSASFLFSQMSGGKLVYSLSLLFLSFLLLSAFMLFFMAVIQVSILMSPDIYQPLLVLDFDDKELSLISSFALIRIFDAFIIGSPILTIVTFAFTRRILPGFLLAILLGATYLITLYLMVILGKNYIRFATPEVSGARLILRVFILLGYTIVFSLLYLIPFVINNLMPQVIEAFLATPETFRRILTYIPPFSATYLVALIYAGNGSTQGIAIPILSSLGYLVIAWISFKKMISVVGEIPYLSQLVSARKEVMMGAPKIRPPFIGIIRKDFKLLIRQVNYAMLLFLGPVLFGIYAIIYYLMEIPLTMLTGMSYVIIFTIFMTATSILAIDGKGGEFLLSLPVSLKDIAKSKAFLITTSYVIFGVFALVFFAIVLPHEISLGEAILLNTVGVFAGSYRVLRKAITQVMERGEPLTDLAKNVIYLLYVMGISLIYGILPLIIVQLSFLIRIRIVETLIIALIFQIIYFVTYKISK